METGWNRHQETWTASGCEQHRQPFCTWGRAELMSKPGPRRASVFLPPITGQLHHPPAVYMPRPQREASCTFSRLGLHDQSLAVSSKPSDAWNTEARTNGKKKKSSRSTSYWAALFTFLISLKKYLTRSRFLVVEEMHFIMAEKAWLLAAGGEGLSGQLHPQPGSREWWMLMPPA